MKFFFYIFIGCLVNSCAYTQDTPAVKFFYSQQRIDPQDIILHIKAVVNKGHLLYSINKTSLDLPYSEIKFDSAAVRWIVGQPIENGHLLTYKDPAFQNAILKGTGDSIEWQQKIRVSSGLSPKISGTITYMLKEGKGYNSYIQEFSFLIGKGSPVAPKKQVSNHSGSTSLLGILLIAFLAGIGTVLTPCVFPLIPVTVGFFTKKSKTREDGIRNALLYSLCIVIIYTIPTFILTAVFGDSILYRISSSTFANLLFFVVFILFAISFFGAFEINLPSSWANAADNKASRGGWIGIFFMALTLVIVSFSCTGPILSSLVTGTVSQGIHFGTAAGMLAFSMGLALPFSLFAFFPTLVHSLPRSGGWLNSVKVMFGFLELALALKFFSNADLANHWHLLDREIFLALWIVVFILLGVYLLGKLKFSHDTDLGYISVPRLFLGILSFSFAMYMVPGMWGAPLNFLTGLLPPASTLDFNLNEIQYDLNHLKNTNFQLGPGLSAKMKPIKYVDLFHVPFGLEAYYDVNEAMMASKEVNKPVMIDFTGHSCANCRKMENEVWSKPEVLQILRNEFVLLSLYVDDKTDLAPEEQYVSHVDGSKITTIGAKNLEFEQSKFHEIAQPLYMFMDSTGKILSDIKYGYDPDEQKFISHLQEVLISYKNNRNDK